MTITRILTATAEAAMAPLQLDYLPPEHLASRPASWWQNVLGVVNFGKPLLLDGAQVPITANMIAPLRSADDLCEVWRVGGRPVRLSNGAAGQSRVHYRYCEDLLFGSITVDERLFGPGAAAHAGTDAGALSGAT